MSDNERIKKVEDAVLILQDLILRFDERIDTFREDMARSREDFDFKMNALIDSQIRHDEEVAELKVSTQQLERASRSQLGRIERLEAT